MEYKLKHKKYFECGNKEEFFEKLKKIDKDLIISLNKMFKNIESNGYLNFINFAPNIEDGKECLMTLVFEAEMDFKEPQKIIQNGKIYNGGYSIKLFKSNENKLEFLQTCLEGFCFSNEKQDFILLPKNNEENISIIIEIEKNPKIYFLAKDKKEILNFQNESLHLYLSHMFLYYFAQKNKFYTEIYNEIRELKNKGINEITIFKMYNFYFFSNPIFQKEYFENLKKENKIDFFFSKYLEKYSEKLPFLLNYMIFSIKLNEKENKELLQYYKNRFFISENIFKDLIQNKKDFFEFIVKYFEKENYFCTSEQFLDLYIYSKLFGYSLDKNKINKIKKIEKFLINIFFGTE